MQFIGHRGASAQAPENTLKAVRLALTISEGFEVDLQVLKDGTVVILHDDTISRTAAVSWLSWLLCMMTIGTEDRSRLRRPVSELNLAEARVIEVGDGTHSEPIPTFTDVMRELQPASHCFAEIKADGHSSSSSYDPRLTAASASAAIEAKVSPTQLSWISFSLGALVDIKRRMPEHSAYLVAYVSSAAQAKSIAQLAVRSGLDGIDLNADPSVVTPELVEWLHARGKRMAVWVWKAPGSNDNEAVWDHMDRCGVDYFTSNLPLALHEWRARQPHAETMLAREP